MKTLVDIDENLLSEAMVFAETNTKKATIAAALETFVRRERAARYVVALRLGQAKDLDDPELIAGAQR